MQFRCFRRFFNSRLKNGKRVKVKKDIDCDPRIINKWGHQLFIIYLRLHLGRFARDIADSVFSPHSPAMCDFDFQPLDFFGKLHSLRISQRFSLFVDVSDVQNFAHEFNHWLGFIESGRRD